MDGSGPLGSLWRDPERAFAELRERPRWRDAAAILFALALVPMLLMLSMYARIGGSNAGAWAPWKLLMLALAALLLSLPLAWLLQSWVVWRAGRALGAKEVRYLHGLSALLHARLAALPLLFAGYALAFTEGGTLRLPGASALPFLSTWSRIGVPSSGMAWRLGGAIFLTAATAFYAWFAARSTFGLKGWRALLLALLAL